MTDTPEKKGKKLTMAENDEAHRSKEGIKNAISK